MSTSLAKPYPIHPLAELLPPMTSAEYEALRDQVEAVGRFTDPATLLDGKLLDGRHRQRISSELGIPLPTKEFDPRFGSPADFVYAKALHRNLTDSQKAAAAVRVKQAMGESAKARQLQGLKQNQAPSRKNSTTGAGGDGVNGKSREKAGELFGVSGRYVQDAEYVYKNDRKLFDQVFAGGITLPRAKTDVRRRLKREQLKEAQAGAEKVGSWDIVNGDCLTVLPTLARKTARLIIADPPYNIGIDYGKGAKADRRGDADYLAWTKRWIDECVELLAPDGSLWIVISDEYAGEVRAMLKAMRLRLAEETPGPRLYSRAWIKWYESFGVHVPDGFSRTSRHLFYCTRDPYRFVFHREAFHRLSDRHAKYRDARAANAGLKTWDDVWGVNPPIPRLVENAKERVPGVPTQLPLALITPIVLGCSDPGDLVVDPFVGSGTTCAAAVCNGRRFFGSEECRKTAKLATARVLAACAPVGRKS